MSSERSPSLAEMVRRHIDGAASEWHHCKVGVVTAVDTSTTPPRVSVKPLIKRRVPDTEDGTLQVESQSIVPNVPVQFVGAGGFRLTCPLSDGTLQIGGKTVPATIGLLMLSDESLDAWLAGGGAEVDPELYHHFDLSDGVFIPGLVPFGAPLASWPQDHATLGPDTGPQIHLHADMISLGDVEGNTKNIALDGDSVGSGKLSVSVSSTTPPVATFTYTPPAGTAQTLATLTVTGGSGGEADLTGSVTASATKAKGI